MFYLRTFCPLDTSQTQTADFTWSCRFLAAEKQHRGPPPHDVGRCRMLIPIRCLEAIFHGRAPPDANQRIHATLREPGKRKRRAEGTGPPVRIGDESHDPKASRLRSPRALQEELLGRRLELASDVVSSLRCLGSILDPLATTEQKGSECSGVCEMEGVAPTYCKHSHRSGT